MGDGGWTHEQLNVLDELKAGRANELIAYLLSGQPINDDLATIINKYLDTGSFSWQSSTPKVDPSQVIGMSGLVWVFIEGSANYRRNALR